jgi:hypothetical protein
MELGTGAHAAHYLTHAHASMPPMHFPTCHAMLGAGRTAVVTARHAKNGKAAQLPAHPLAQPHWLHMSTHLQTHGARQC